MNFIRKRSYLFVMLFIFALFAYITYLTPLAGDDWGYAINGLKGNPFATAMQYYQGWSGRFFSELWGFLIAPNKWAWNILNPLFFTAIYYLLYKIINPKENRILISVLIAVLMLSVKDFVRMETYTWIMGTTYVIPLLLSLIYIYMMKQMILYHHNRKYYVPLMTLICFYIGLTMENIAGVMLVLHVLVLLYCFLNKEKHFKILFFPAIASVVSFMLLRMSPGSTFRLHSEHGEWLKFSLFEQIQINWSNFIRYTFADNKYLILALALSLIIVCITKYNSYHNNKIKTGILSGIFLITAFCSMSEFIYAFTKMEILTVFFDIANNPVALIVTSIIYIVFVLAIIYLLFICYVGEDAYEPFLYLAIAGSANVAMMLSPIFGARSSLYTIYFIILLTAYLLSTIKIDKRLSLFVIAVCVVLLVSKTREYLHKYRLVAETQEIRLAEIEYYQDHPEEKDIWIIRMPIYSIHSGDIEYGDEPHRQTFLEYFDLNPDAQIHMYNKE